MLTRGGHDWTHLLPLIEAAAKAVPVSTAVHDGEAVVMDDQGRSDFNMLQQALGGRGGQLTSRDEMFMAFDLLYFHGHDFNKTELSTRRHLIETLVPADGHGAIRHLEEANANGAQLFQAACEHGLEGIIAKRLDSTYRSGRLGDWLKIKCVQSDTFMIVGYEHCMSTRRGVGSSLLAARRGGELVYVGSVGTGFTERVANDLPKARDRIKRKTPSVADAGRRKNLVLAQPTLIIEIDYRAWTRDGNLRHASYKGLREEQDNAKIIQGIDHNYRTRAPQGGPSKSTRIEARRESESSPLRLMRSK